MYSNYIICLSIQFRSLATRVVSTPCRTAVETRETRGGGNVNFGSSFLRHIFICVSTLRIQPSAGTHTRTYIRCSQCVRVCVCTWCVCKKIICMFLVPFTLRPLHTIGRWFVSHSLSQFNFVLGAAQHEWRDKEYHEVYTIFRIGYCFSFSLILIRQSIDGDGYTHTDSVIL